MSIFVALHHVTHYKYDRPIDLGPQTIRLRPAPHTRTPILSYSLKVTPANHFVNWQQDPQGNWLARFVFPEKATELKIEVDFSAQMTVINPFDFFVEPYADSFPFAYTDDLKTELAPYLATSSRRPAVRRLSRRHSARGAEHRQFPGRSQRATAKEDSLHHPDGAGHPDAGTDAGLGRGVVPRLGVAVDPDVPASRARRPFRLGLSHSTASRHRSGRRTARGRERFYRSARLGRSLSSRRGMDRVRRHLGHADRRGAYSRRRHAALPFGRADLGRGRICRSRVRLRDERQAHPRSAADHTAVLGCFLGASRQARRAGRCRPESRRRQIDDGRRADLRFRRRPGIGGMEYFRGRSDQARSGRRSHSQIAQRGSRLAASYISGRANGIPAKACRAGRSGCTGARTACRSGRTPT